MKRSEKLPRLSWRGAAEVIRAVEWLGNGSVWGRSQRGLLSTHVATNGEDGLARRKRNRLPNKEPDAASEARRAKARQGGLTPVQATKPATWLAHPRAEARSSVNSWARAFGRGVPIRGSQNCTRPRPRGIGRFELGDSDEGIMRASPLERRT